MEPALNLTKPTTLTVKRYPGGAGPDARYTYQMESDGGTMSTEVYPKQFPEIFRPLFPNGWVDLAKREGFQLPKSFNQKSGPP